MASWSVVPSLRKRSNNLRSAALIGGAVAIVAVLAIIVAIVASGGSKQVKPKHVDNSVGLVLKIGSVDVQTAGPPAHINSSARQAVLDASQSYVDDAILAPLSKGHLDEAYTRIFDRGVRRSASGPDRPALTEVRTGSLKAPLKATATPVHLDGMGDQTGKLVLVAATFLVDVSAKGSGGPVKIQRLSELTFAPEGGRWLVTAYRVGVTRTTAAQTTAAVARAGTGAIQ
jgi:hypothetical protein